MVMNEDLGAPASPSGSRATHEAPSGLHPSGFDPSRLERLALSLRAHAYAMGAPRTEQDEEIALGTARLVLPALEDSATSCRNCEGADWVCENHRDRPWGGISASPIACECGAGAPCGVCNLEMASAGYSEPWRELAAQAISNVRSAVRETNWGQPTFGPDAAEELQAEYDKLLNHARDSDGSGEAGQTAKQAGPGGRQRGGRRPIAQLNPVKGHKR